ncbi:MAG: flotillin domain-containing protein [Pseudomonadota bacterium]
MNIFASVFVFLVIAFIIVVILWIIFWWLYQRATKEVAFVRTGLGGQTVVESGGAFVIPVLHDLTRVTMTTYRLEVSRRDRDSIITRDRLRIDVTAEFYVRVGASREAIAIAAQALGAKTARAESMRDLLEGRFVDALRTVAAEMTIQELHEQRGEYIRRVKELVAGEIEQTGLELESASLTALDQTNREFFDPNNAFDAEGLTRLTADIEERRLKRNAIEQDSVVSLQQKELETEKRRLELTREAEYARLAQQEEVAVRRAEQNARVVAEEAAKRQAAEEARVASELAINVATTRADQDRELERLAAESEVERRDTAKKREIEEAAIESELAVQLRRIEREQRLAMERAAKHAETTRVEAERKREADEAAIQNATETDKLKIAQERDLALDRVASDRDVDLARATRKETLAKRDLDVEAEIDRHAITNKQVVTEAEHERDVAVAQSQLGQIKALSEAERAKADLVKAEEELTLLRAREREERENVVALIKARTQAERDTVGMLVAAEARFREAEDIAKAAAVETTSKAERIRTIADAEATAEKSHAEAEAVRRQVDAKAARALTEAENAMSTELMELKVRLSVIAHLKEIIRESAKPMEEIDDIRIIQLTGLAGAEGAGGGPAGDGAAGSGSGDGRGGESLPDQVVNSALRYRAHAPVVDSLLKEVGLSSVDAASVQKFLSAGLEKKSDREDGPDED